MDGVKMALGRRKGINTTYINSWGGRRGIHDSSNTFRLLSIKTEKCKDMTYPEIKFYIIFIPQFFHGGSGGPSSNIFMK